MEVHILCEFLHKGEIMSCRDLSYFNRVTFGHCRTNFLFLKNSKTSSKNCKIQAIPINIFCLEIAASRTVGTMFWLPGLQHKCLFFKYGWNFTDTHNFTLQHRREPFALCIIVLLCCTYQPRLWALKLSP